MQGLQATAVESVVSRTTLVCGYGDAGLHFRSQLVLVLVCSLPKVTPSAPCTRASKVSIETVVSETDIFASPTCNFNISTLDHMKKLKNNAFVTKHQTL